MASATRPYHGGMNSLAPLMADWYRKAARDLPWRRDGTTPWGELVSEIMLQQTPAARVVPYWQRWMTDWPQPGDLAAANPADVIRAWGTLGYPRRSLWLRECAVTIARSHGGEVPDDEAVLRTLPGIGQYTAAAIASFAFGRRAVVLDTNIRRVIARVFGGQALPPPGLTASERARAESLLPRDAAAAVDWNRATMELGALICHARQPDCPACPLEAACAWRRNGYPGDAHAGARRVQRYEGTDREARGRVMGMLRQGDGTAIAVAAIVAALPRPDQAKRAIAGLVADGLAVPDGADLRLPG